MKVTPEMLYEYQVQTIEHNSFSFGKNKKLIPNLCKKTEQKIYYQNLKLYLNLGLEIKKHITLEFNPFIKQYLEHCTNLQREVEKKLEKSKSKIIN